MAAAGQPTLPVEEKKNDFLTIFNDHQVMVVQSETGSGKSTKLPLYALEHLEMQNRRPSKVLCTQPRRLPCKSVSEFVSKATYSGGCLGDYVAYAVRFDDTTGPWTKIVYCTEGILLNVIRRDPKLTEYGAIFVDEAHEQSIPGSVLLGWLKKVLQDGTHLKIVIMSATIQADLFQSFFGGAAICPSLVIEGRQYHVEIVYEDFMGELTHETEDEYRGTKYAAHIVKSVLKEGTRGHIIIFMPGEFEIAQTCTELHKLLQGNQRTPIYPLISSLPLEQQQEAVNSAAPGTTKIIVSTNIAETSITIDGVSCVIDAGESKIRVYDVATGIDQLDCVAASKTSSAQRAGRAGRTGDGVCYRLCSEEAYLMSSPLFTEPAINRERLDGYALMLKSLGIKDIHEDFYHIIPPKIDRLQDGVNHLHQLGALDSPSFSGNLTPLGKKMARLPLDPSLAKVLLKSVEYRTTDAVINVVAVLSLNNSIFYIPMDTDQRHAARTAIRKAFAGQRSDHLAFDHILGIFKELYVTRTRQHATAECKNYYLKFHALELAYHIAGQLKEMLTASTGDEIPECDRSSQDFHNRFFQTFLSGYPNNVARQSYKNYQFPATDGTYNYADLHQSSLLQGSDPPVPLVFFNNCLKPPTGQLAIRVASEIQPEWLPDSPWKQTVIDLSKKKDVYVKKVRLTPKNRGWLCESVIGDRLHHLVQHNPFFEKVDKNIKNVLVIHGEIIVICNSGGLGERLCEYFNSGEKMQGDSFMAKFEERK